MKTKVLTDLVTLTHTQLVKEQQRAQPGLNAIRKLRAQRAAIDELDRRSTPAADMLHMRAVGADVAWRGWLDRKRREVNLCLARHLAEQDHIMQDLKKAQGRHDTLMSVLEQAQIEVKQSALRSLEVQLLEAVLRNRRPKREV